jgi:hypothetical protein
VITPIDVPEAIAAYVVIALTLFLGGWCRFQINARRFRRRTIGGGQRFPSYGAAVLTRLWEGVVMSCATIFMFSAILVGLGLAAWMVRYG